MSIKWQCCAALRTCDNPQLSFLLHSNLLYQLLFLASVFPHSSSLIFLAGSEEWRDGGISEWLWKIRGFSVRCYQIGAGQIRESRIQIRCAGFSYRSPEEVWFKWFIGWLLSTVPFPDPRCRFPKLRWYSLFSSSSPTTTLTLSLSVFCSLISPIVAWFLDFIIFFLRFHHL